MKKLKKGIFYILAITFMLLLYFAFATKDTLSYLTISLAVISGSLAIKNSKHLTING